MVSCPLWWCACVWGGGARGVCVSQYTPECWVVPHNRGAEWFVRTGSLTFSVTTCAAGLTSPPSDVAVEAIVDVSVLILKLNEAGVQERVVCVFLGVEVVLVFCWLL